VASARYLDPVSPETGAFISRRLMGEREILGRISPEKRSRPAQGSEPAAKFSLEGAMKVRFVAAASLRPEPQGALNVT
jgi:hypothetical protein